MENYDDLREAKRVLEVEAQCILAARDRLDHRFVSSIEIIINAVKHGGKVVVSGVGKSGKVAAKVAATLTSMGTPALYLHPTEASHGDLGVVTSRDVMLLFSYSGTSGEIMDLLPSLRERTTKIISVVGNDKSPLALRSDIALDGSVAQEACPLNLAPTSSTTVALALGDALAVALSRRFDFKEEQFAENHPGGALGRRLTLRVCDLMKTGDAVPWVNPDALMDIVVSASSEKKLGVVLVRDNAERNVKTSSQPQRMAGLITDGDIRRALKHKAKFFELQAKDVMTRSPVSISAHERAIHALALMENRPSQLSVLPVIDDSQNCLGILRLHDVIGRF